MEATELTAALHHRELHIHLGWVQFATVMTGFLLAYAVATAQLSELHRQGGLRKLLTGAVEVLGFFLLGFVAVGLLLPPVT